MADVGPHEGPPALDRYRNMLRSTWPVILLIAALVTVVAVVVNGSRDKVYAASSDVYLTRFDIPGQLGGLSDFGLNQPAQRWIETQAGLARVPEVANGAIAIAKVPGATAASLLSSSSVTPQPNADLLTFRVRDRQPAAAAKLADAYAQSFAKYRSSLDAAAVQKVIGDVEDELNKLYRRRTTQTSLVRALKADLAQLRAVRALQTSNVTVVRPAGGAVEVKRSRLAAGLAGGALGLALGLGVALLVEALDRRVSSEGEMARRLGLPVLGRLPPPDRRHPPPQLLMMDPTETKEAEAFRLTRANVELAAGDHRLIMLSAVEREVDASPSIAANLALALARNSKRTILVDLDVRRGALDRLFGTDDRKGLTDVVAGELDLDAALVTVWSEHASSTDADVGASSGSTGEATLELLPIGSPPQSVGEFVASPRLQAVLKSLREEAALVVIHGPPLIGTADVLALSGAIDGLIVIAGVGLVRRDVISNLGDTLSGFVDTLGVIVIGAGDAPIAPMVRGRTVSGSSQRAANE